VAALRLDWGTLSLAASASHGDGQDGLAAAAGYLYREGSFSVRAGHRELSAAYAVADPFAGPRLLRHESLAGVGYGTAAAGNIDLQYLHSVFRDRSGTRAVALNYSRTLLRRVGLFAVLRRVLGDAADTEAFVGLSASLGPYRSLSAYSASAGQGHTEVVQAGDTLGPREGFGYRVSAERDTQNGVETRRFLPYVEYGGRNGTLIAEARTVRSGGESFDYAAVAVQGALAAVTGGAGLTRRIDDSFAQVRIEPPAAGVRVYHNGQDVGRTDEAGRLLVPALASFIDNPVAIEDRDLPLEYNVRRTVRTLSPPFRGGAVARFDAKVAAGVSGRLYRRTAAGLEPLEYHEAHLWIAGKHVAFPTGSGGEFYFEDLARGVYDGRARIGDQTCAFRLAVPEPAGPVTEIDPPVVCDALP
jgi:outer membrane usher protein